jgi:hypothetical protein
MATTEWPAFVGVRGRNKGKQNKLCSGVVIPATLGSRLTRALIVPRVVPRVVSKRTDRSHHPASTPHAAGPANRQNTLGINESDLHRAGNSANYSYDTRRYQLKRNNQDPVQEPSVLRKNSAAERPFPLPRAVTTHNERLP